MAGGARGKARPGQRACSSAPAIACGAELPGGCRLRLREATKHQLGGSTRRSYRNRIKAIITFWPKSTDAWLKEYVAQGTARASEAGQKDPAKYFFNGKYKQDLRYECLHHAAPIIFLGESKLRMKQGRQVMKPHSDLCKYCDAIKWGAKEAGENLPESFYYEAEQWLDGCKKSHAQEKLKGSAEESKAHSLPAGLLRLTLQWALGEGNAAKV